MYIFVSSPFFYESSMITRNDRGEKKLSDVHAKKWICNIKKKSNLHRINYLKNNQHAGALLYAHFMNILPYNFPSNRRVQTHLLCDVIGLKAESFQHWLSQKRGTFFKEFQLYSICNICNTQYCKNF